MLIFSFFSVFSFGFVVSSVARLAWLCCSLLLFAGGGGGGSVEAQRKGGGGSRQIVKECNEYIMYLEPVKAMMLLLLLLLLCARSLAGYCLLACLRFLPVPTVMVLNISTRECKQNDTRRTLV